MDNTQPTAAETFMASPATFLAKNVVVVRNDATGTPDETPVEFLLLPTNGTDNNAWFLVEKPAKSAATDTIKAYWVPWAKGKASSLVLGADANFMFTSEMTNCRFSVLTTDMKRPRVAHVPGTEGKSDRDKKEVEDGFPSRADDKQTKLMRRFSSTGLKTSEFGIEEKHFYCGQNGAFKSSAFVFGVRDTTTGMWAFYAQVVEGVMAGNGIDALKKAKQELKICNGAFRFA